MVFINSIKVKESQFKSSTFHLLDLRETPPPHTHTHTRTYTHYTHTNTPELGHPAHTHTNKLESPEAGLLFHHANLQDPEIF